MAEHNTNVFSKALYCLLTHKGTFWKKYTSYDQVHNRDM